MQQSDRIHDPPESSPDRSSVLQTMNHSRDMLHSPIFSLPDVKDWKIAREQRMSNQRQALAKEIHPWQFLAQHPFSQADIPLSRLRLFPGNFEVIAIVDYELLPGLTTITRDPSASCKNPRGLCFPSPSLSGTHALILVL